MATRREIETAIRDGRKLWLYGCPKTVTIKSAEIVPEGINDNLWQVVLSNGSRGMNAGGNILIESPPRPPQDAMKRFIRAMTF